MASQIRAFWKGIGFLVLAALPALVIAFYSIVINPPTHEDIEPKSAVVSKPVQ